MAWKIFNRLTLLSVLFIGALAAQQVDVANVSRINSALYCPDTSSTVNFIQCNTTSTLIPIYTAGQSIIVMVANSNTGFVTIAVNGMGTKGVTKNGTNALVTGDMLVGGMYLLTYDGTRFVTYICPTNNPPSNTNILQGNGTGGFGTGYTTSGTGTVVVLTASPTFSGIVTEVAIQSSGTAPTISGCGTPTTQTGGATAGTFTALSSTCVAVLTFSQAASHGYSCYANDMGTAVTFRQTAVSSNSATLTASGSTTSGDVINFSCTGY